MDLFEELRQILLQRKDDGEFPAWLMVDAMVIASDPQRYEDKAELVETLITQIKDFDAYAGVGCFATSVGAETIGATLRKILQL